MSVAFILYLAGSYLLGSIPTGYWLGKYWKGIDVRQHGSGNLGATNVFRVLGTGPGIITLGFDILKGFVPTAAAQRYFPGHIALIIAAGLAAILGHTMSIFVHFRGGKGVATSAGVFLALLPVPSVIAVSVFALSLLLTRIVSLSSMIAVVGLTLSAFFLAPVRQLFYAAAAVSSMILWTHRSNIKRLLNGTESRIAWPKEKPV